jgi:hypothetical protein
MGFNAGPPVMPSAYNNNVQLFQNRDYVVIYNEMIHNARIVPLDGRPHSTIPQWAGSSRGHWEGDTLVVETVNFSNQTSFPNSSPTMHLVERFTRVGPNTLMYRYTVSDPSTWMKPWTVEFPMLNSHEQIYEYACHEGNHAMIGILGGARASEGRSGGGEEGIELILDRTRLEGRIRAQKRLSATLEETSQCAEARYL